MCPDQPEYSLSDAPFDTTGTAFVFGCGYLGIRVAQRLVSQSWKVIALTRSQSRAADLVKQGVFPVIGDWTDRRTFENPEIAEPLAQQATRVLISVGYDSRSGMDRRQVYVEGLRNALKHISPSSDLVYVSSTGVYHQADSHWVDESSPCRPEREGGRAHLEAERLLRRLRIDAANAGQHRYSHLGKTVVLRMAGLYGPNRVPRVASIRSGEPIPADPTGYLNLIHIDDAAASVMAAWMHPAPEPLYLIADGRPVIRGEYFQEISRIVGGPPVRYTGDAGPRSDSSKRIWNRRMKRDLLARLQYPSYREGLRSILRESHR